MFPFDDVIMTWYDDTTSATDGLSPLTDKLLTKSISNMEENGELDEMTR